MSRKKNRSTSMYDAFRNNPAMNRVMIIERMYLRHLTDWASSRFKWTGLPESIDERFIEMELFHRGLVLFYHDKNVGKELAVRGASWGEPNMYDNPTKFYTVSIGPYEGVQLKNALNPHVDVPEDGKGFCVPIWSTYTRMVSRDVVQIYARRLAELDTSLEINARQLRNSRLVSAPDGQRMTWTNIIRQQDEGQPVVWGTDGLDTSQLQVFDIGGNPINLDSLRLEKNQVWNEAMTMLGITNSNQDKKERLVSAEASGSDGQVLAARNAAMKPRREAAEKINELYGLNVSVEWDLEDAEGRGSEEEFDDGEGEDDGNIHSRVEED